MKFLSTLFFTLLLAVGAQAATTQTLIAPPETLPLKRDVAMSYYLTQITSLSVSVDAESMIYNEQTKEGFWKNYENAGQPSVKELLELLGSEKLMYELARPESDKVRVHAFYYDAKGRALFSGSTQVEPIFDSSKQKWVVPNGLALLEINPAYEVPLPIANVVWGQFIERDEDGNIIGRYYLTINEGGAFIPSWVFDKRGELYVRFWNGEDYETVVYDSETQSQIDPSLLVNDVVGTFTNVQVVAPQNGSIIPKPMVSNNGIGYSDLVEVMITYDDWYFVHAKTSEGELFSAVIVQELGKNFEQRYERTNPALYVPVPLKAGKRYHIRFEWPSFRSPNESSGGGKG